MVLEACWIMAGSKGLRHCNLGVFNLISQVPQSQARPLVVDLDGTLIRTDMLWECLVLLIKRRPWDIWKVIPWVLKGKAHLKRRLVDVLNPEVSLIPFNDQVVSWLETQKSQGVPLVLATASDQRIADAIAERLALFERVIGTTECNLSSDRKAHRLVEDYGFEGFEYVGNSKADFAVWKNAAVCHVVNPDRGVLRRVRRSYTLGQVFEDRRPFWKVLFKALRIHQWVKNLLLFVPLLAAHQMDSIMLVFSGLLAFLAFGACASSVYLLNDLLDLASDRAHETKKNRPLAAGTLPISVALGLIPFLLILSFGGAIAFLPMAFTFWLLVYFVITFAYSFLLKGVVLVDVVTLSFLYTLRVLSGTAVFALKPTFWLLTFSVFVFLSLAFVKRYTELRRGRLAGVNQKVAGRGYVPDDYELLASLGSSAGYLAVLVFALFINDPATQEMYRSPQLLWLICPLLLFWISRVWLVAHRGRMNDDPILFAIKDRGSQAVGFLFFALFVAAYLLPLS